MKIELYDYQRDAISRMRNGSILCGGVGSGKSRTSIAYYFKCVGGDLDNPKLLRAKVLKSLYIITTARKRDTKEWDNEIGHFGMSVNPKTNLYCQEVHIDSWNNIGKYSEVKDAFFIFDEQRVIGSGSWVKAFLKIAKSNEWILLSATPGDTWTDYVPVFIANGYFKNRTEFVRSHVVYSRFSKFPKIDRYLDTKRLERMRDSVLVNMDFHRETISHHEKIMCSYNVSDYKILTRTRWDILKDAPIQSASELCYAFRKIVNSDPSRGQAVLDILKEHKRLIVFYNFDYELDILKKLPYPNETQIAEWNGHKHQPIPETESWIYLVQYTAGAEGWNCITTDTIIFYSQNYSYKVMVQSSGRIDRLNTPYHELWYYHLKSSAPIDIAIARALNQKKSFNAGVFGNKIMDNSLPSFKNKSGHCPG